MFDFLSGSVIWAALFFHSGYVGGSGYIEPAGFILSVAKDLGPG